MGVVPAQDLEYDFVQTVAEVGNLRRERVLYQRSRCDIGWQPNIGGFDGPHRVEVGICRLHG